MSSLRRRYFSLPRWDYHPEEMAGIFGLGLNSDAQPYALRDGECRACQNVTSTVRGSIRKRDGCQTLATAGTNLTGLYASPSPSFLIAAGGTVLYSINSAGTVTTIKTGMTNGALWSWVNAPANGGQGPLYGTNGTDIQQWDGVAATTSAWTAATGTLPSTAKYLAVAGNKVFAAGMSTFAPTADPGSTLAWSNLANPRDWPAINTVMFDPNDGEQISGIGTIGPYVLVFKPSKAWVVYDLDSGANRRLGENVGCVSHRSIVETPGGTFFLGKDGIYNTNGSAAKNITQGRVSSVIASIVPAQRGLAAGRFFGSHYYLSICTSGSVNNLLLDYDMQQDSFWQHQIAGSQAPAQMAVWEGDGTPRLYGARGGGTVVSRLFVPGELQDNAAVFPGSWSSPFYTFGMPYMRKWLRSVHFDGSGHIQASLAKDFSSAAALASDVDFTAGQELFGTGTVPFGTGTDSFGGTKLVSEARIKTPGIARAWSVTYGNTTAQGFEVDSFTMLLGDKLRKAVA